MIEKTSLKNERGVVLVVALVILLVLTLIGLSGMSTTVSENAISGNQRLYNEAFYAADAGIEAFKADAPTNLAFLSTADSSGNYFGGPKEVGEKSDTYDVRWERLGFMQDTGRLAYKVTSVGTAPNFPFSGTVTVEAIIEIGGGSPEGY